MNIRKYINLSNIKKALKTLIGFILNPRFLMCFGIAWMITNGWAYIVLVLGIFMDVVWMQALGGAYLGLMWIPMTPEKILTIAISIFMLKILFPKDQKTLGVLIELKNKAIDSFNKMRAKSKNKK